jgi:GntR family transcriptional regulator
MNSVTAVPAKPDFQPLYAQIQALIMRRIGDGAWKPGELLPSEYELAAEYGVSQGTVRKALIALEGERLIVRRQGVGTYVARHARDTALFRFFRMVEPNGARVTPRSRVLRQAVRQATGAQAACLGLPSGAKLHTVTRLRLLGTTPSIYEEIFVPVALVPSLDLPRDGEMSDEMYVIYQERHGILVSRVKEKLRAMAAGTKEAGALLIPVGTPLLEIVRVAFDVNGRPIELRISRCDTCNYRYSADLSETDAGQ